MAKRHYGEHGAHKIGSEERKEMSGYYEGHVDRRHQEMQDAGMIREDKSAIANLPQEVMIKPYPRNGSYMPEQLDDSDRGVRKQMNLDDSQRDKHNVPKKV